MDQDFFRQVVSASGLPALIAAPSLQRAIERAGKSIAQLTPADLPELMPGIERSLRLYLPAADVAARVRALRSLANGGGVAQGR